MQVRRVACGNAHVRDPLLLGFPIRDEQIFLPAGRLLHSLGVSVLSRLAMAPAVKAHGSNKLRCFLKVRAAAWALVVSKGRVHWNSCIC